MNLSQQHNLELEVMLLILGIKAGILGHSMTEMKASIFTVA